jgi:hypothetical protein
LIDFEPENKGTNITEAIRYLTNAIKKRCTSFIISDFIQNEPDFDKALSIANNKHDIVALRIYDERETELPPIGMVKLKDAETNEYIWVDSSSKKVRDNYASWWRETSQKLDTAFKKSGVDYANINTNEDYVRSLMTLFKKRGLKA